MPVINVLIAEDVDLLREDFEEIINSAEDMKVTGLAGSGKKIVELTEERNCDVILMDIEMEEIHAGIHAAEAIHEVHPDIKIIFMTVHDSDEMIHGAMGTGAVDYIVKGCSNDEIYDRIRKAYTGETSLDPKIQRSLVQEYTRLKQSEYSLLFFINNVSKLTAAEQELVKLLLHDKKVAEIAKIRCVEAVTVKSQIKSLLRKFGCKRSREIVDMIRSKGLEKLFI